MSDSVTGNTQGFTAIVQAEAAAMQVSANRAPGAPVLTFTPGSVLLAIAQAVAGVALWLQAMCLNLLNYGRAVTSRGVDLDSWMAQFQFTRIPATPARCTTVVLSRFSTGVAVSLLPGGIVQTAVGNVRFAIVGDTAQSAWNQSAGAYQIDANTSSCQVTVVAATLGLGGNVAAASITQYASGVVGFDTVTNTGPASGGANAESDSAFLARFWLYLQYLFRATGPAVQYAIASIQPGITSTITDGYNESAQLTPGYFFATIDDGTGSPSAELVAAAALAAYNTRALGIQSAAHACTTLAVNVLATIVTSNPTIDGPAAYNAAQAFIKGCVLGTGVSYFRIGTAMENSSPTIYELQSLTLNGSPADIIAVKTQKVVPGSITINTVAP